MSHINNLDSLLSKLRALPGTIQEGVLDGVQESVNEIKQDAKNLCPVSTGALRDSIVAEVRKESNNLIEGTVTAKKDYAVAVEFGTGRLGSQSSEASMLGLSIPHEIDIAGRAPKPFLYPAYILHRDECVDDIANQINQTIRKVAK